MNKPNIILIGAGGHAKSCIDVINSESKYNIFGLIGLSSQVGSKVCGYPVIGTDDQLNEIVNDVSQAVIAIGDQKKRSILYKYLINNGFKLPNIIAKGARRFKNPNSAILQPCNYIDMVYIFSVACTISLSVYVYLFICIIGNNKNTWYTHNKN